MKKFLKGMLVSLVGLSIGVNSIIVSAEEITEVTVSTMGTSLPWSFIDEDGGEWQGVDGEIWAEIEKRSGWNVEIIRAGAFDSTLGNIASGRADVASNHFAVTPERLGTYDATKPYSTDIGVIATRTEDEDLKTLADFKDKKIGVISGQSAEILVRDLAEEKGYEVVTYENTDPGLQDLKNGKIDGFATSQTDLADYMANTGNEYRVIDEHLDEQPIVFLLAKTETSGQLKDELNKLIDEMLEDGTIAEITEKWFGDDMTQYIDTAVEDFNEKNDMDISNGSSNE